MKAILHVLGVLLIVAWLVLWLAVKITFGVIHLLLLFGIVAIIFGLLKSRSSASGV